MLCTVQAGLTDAFFLTLPFFPANPIQNTGYEKKTKKIKNKIGTSPRILISNPSFGKLVGASNVIDMTWNPESDEYATLEKKKKRKKKNQDAPLPQYAIWQNNNQKGPEKKIPELEMNTMSLRDCGKG